jgi:hypothetical protein
MNYLETDHLRVLIANERKDRLALVAPIVVALGHEVIAREIDVEDVGAVTTRERPDVALVGLGESSEHALNLIHKIVREAACPVIVLLHSPDHNFVKEASKLGAFAHINDTDIEDWQSAINHYAESPGTTATARHWKESSKERLVIHADRWKILAVVGLGPRRLGRGRGRHELDPLECDRPGVGRTAPIVSRPCRPMLLIGFSTTRNRRQRLDPSSDHPEAMTVACQRTAVRDRTNGRRRCCAPTRARMAIHDRTMWNRP